MQRLTRTARCQLRVDAESDDGSLLGGQSLARQRAVVSAIAVEVGHRGEVVAFQHGDAGIIAVRHPGQASCARPRHRCPPGRRGRSTYSDAHARPAAVHRAPRRRQRSVGRSEAPAYQSPNSWRHVKGPPFPRATAFRPRRQHRCPPSAARSMGMEELVDRRTCCTGPVAGRDVAGASRSRRVRRLRLVRRHAVRRH